VGVVPSDIPKVVEVEEIAAAAAGVQNMLLAAHALGLGSHVANGTSRLRARGEAISGIARSRSSSLIRLSRISGRIEAAGAGLRFSPPHDVAGLGIGFRRCALCVMRCAGRVASCSFFVIPRRPECKTGLEGGGPLPHLGAKVGPTLGSKAHLGPEGRVGFAGPPYGVRARGANKTRITKAENEDGARRLRGGPSDQTAWTASPRRAWNLRQP
jgi:hypothetical protein